MPEAAIPEGCRSGGKNVASGTSLYGASRRAFLRIECNSTQFESAAPWLEPGLPNENSHVAVLTKAPHADADENFPRADVSLTLAGEPPLSGLSPPALLAGSTRWPKAFRSGPRTSHLQIRK